MTPDTRLRRAEAPLENCERCGNLMPEGCIGWCRECDNREKANRECPNCMVGGYGAFPGGDPRLFHPDGECSTAGERAAHSLACAAWERGDRPRVPVSGVEWVKDPRGDGLAFVERSAYGLGVYDVFCDLHKPGAL